jgi:LysR family transcriptional regulator, hca operon transcriptional activator
MELRHLRYFVAVVEEQNFSRAAKRLHISQPPLSTQIRQLEEEIGTPLLLRNKHSVHLTEAGGIFLTKARKALALVKEAVEDSRSAGTQKRSPQPRRRGAHWPLSPEKSHASTA